MGKTILFILQHRLAWLAITSWRRLGPTPSMITRSRLSRVRICISLLFLSVWLKWLKLLFSQISTTCRRSRTPRRSSARSFSSAIFSCQSISGPRRGGSRGREEGTDTSQEARFVMYSYSNIGCTLVVTIATTTTKHYQLNSSSNNDNDNYNKKSKNNRSSSNSYNNNRKNDNNNIP